MGTIKNNPLLVFSIIGLLIAVFNIGQSLFSEQATQSQAAIEKLQNDNLAKRQALEKQLIQLKNITNPSEHNIWHIGHLEKSIAHLKRYQAPRFQATGSMLYHRITTASIIGTLLIVAMLYTWHRIRNRSKYPPKVGLHSSARIRPNNDPVAAKTHWQTLASGAANFQQQQLITTETGLKIIASFELRVLCWAGIGGGLAPIILTYIFMWEQLDSIVSPWLKMPSLFIIAGILFNRLLTQKNITIDASNQVIHAANNTIGFNEVHALQVITSLAGGKGHGIYQNNELNLVLKNGQRVNLLNHGAQAAFEYQEAQLSQLLAVPIWQA